MSHETDDKPDESGPIIVVWQNQEITNAVFTDEQEALAFESVWG